MSQTAKTEKASPAIKWRTKVSDENPDLLKKAQEELNENPEQRDQDIQTLREMVLGEEKLKSPTDDAFLLKFLRVRKFDIARAFELLKQYYSVRNKYPIVFVNYRPSSVLKFFSEGACFLLPYRDQLGRALILAKGGKWDAASYSLDDYVAAIVNCVEQALLEEETQINGFIIICDLKDFGFDHAIRITPNSARRAVFLVQDCMPGRLKGVHFIFEPFFFGLVFLMFKPFFSQKMRSRIGFHGCDVESLHEIIHPEFLPEDYGGSQPSSDVPAAEFVQTIRAREDEIVHNMENFGYIEAQAVD